MTDLTGKVALVSGASRGIGAATAKKLAQLGADVAITYQSRKTEADAVVAELGDMGRRAIAIRADIAHAADIVSAFEQTTTTFGRLDIVVNNAGVGSMGLLDTVTLAEVDRVIDVNVRGAFLVARTAATHMNDGGRLINLGSCIIDRAPGAGMVLYAMSKSAIAGLTKALARELAPRSITVNMVNPGATDTEMNPADGPGADVLLPLVALGRYARAEEIAAVIAHIADADCAYVTGAAVNVDGGFTA
jgi:3-oxoacyl-[acyl-carrier protein] reductase